MATQQAGLGEAPKADGAGLEGRRAMGVATAYELSTPDLGQQAEGEEQRGACGQGASLGAAPPGPGGGTATGPQPPAQVVDASQEGLGSDGNQRAAKRPRLDTGDPAGNGRPMGSLGPEPQTAEQTGCSAVGSGMAGVVGDGGCGGFSSAGGGGDAGGGTVGPAAPRSLGGVVLRSGTRSAAQSSAHASRGKAPAGWGLPVGGLQQQQEQQQQGPSQQREQQLEQAQHKEQAQEQGREQQQQEPQQEQQQGRLEQQEQPQEQEQRREQQQQESEQEQQQEQGPQQGTAAGPRGRVQRIAVTIGPPVDPAGPAAPQVVFTPSMNVGWICATADMVKCLLPADVLEQAKADIRKVRTSNKGENSNHILKAYHVTVHARPRSGGADTVPCRVALLPYCRPASNGAAWHLSRLQELREQLQLPCGGRVRVVREVRQDNTIALVVEPEGRLDGAESAGAAQERGGRGVHGRTAAEGAGGAGTIKEEQDGGSRPGVRRRLTYGEGAAQGAGTSGQGGEGGGNETELDTDDSDVMFMEERSGGARGGDGQPPEVLAQAGGGEQSGGRVQGQAGGYRRAAAARRQAGAEALRRIRTCVGDESSDSGSNGTEEGGEDTDEDYSGSDDGAVGAASAEAARGGHGPDGPGNGRIRFSIIGLSIKTVRQLWPSSFGEDGKPRQSEVAVEVWAATGLPKASSVGQHDGAAAAGAGPSAQGQAPRALRRYPMRLRFSHHVIYLAGCPALTKDLAITDNNSAMLTRLPDGRVLVERRAQRRGRSGVDYPQRQACEAPAPCSAQGASGGHTVGGGDSGSVGRLVQSQLHLPQATKGKLLPDVEEGQHVDFFAVPCSTQAGEQVAASGGPAEGTGSGAAAGGTAAAGSDPTRYGPFTLLLKNCGHWYFNAAQPLWQCFGQRSGILCLSRLPDGPEGRARVLAEWMGSGGEPSPAPHAAEAAHNSRAAEPYAVDLVAARLAAGHGQEGAHGGAVAGQHRVEQQGNEQGGVAVRGGIAGEKRRDGGTGPGAPQAGMGQQQLQATKRRRATSEGGIPLAEPPTDLTRSGPAPGTAAAICDRKLRLCYTRIGVGILPWFLQARDILPRTRAAMQAQQQGQQEHAAGSGAGLLPSGTAANEGVAVHRVRLFVRQGHVRKCFLVALRQKQGSSSELSCPEPVRAALGPGVSYGTAIQLLRCVGEGGVVEVELRLRPEQQGGDGLGAAEAVEGQRGAGPAAVPTERLFGARAPAAEAAEGPNVQVHEGAGPAAVQLLQEYTAPTSAEARGQQGRDVGLSAACTQGRQEGQVGPSAAEVQRQQGGQGGSKAAWETAQQAAHGTAECTTRGGGVLQAAGQVQGGAGADLQCEVRSWAGTARDAGLQGGGPLPVGEALCASGDGAGTSAAVQPAHTAGGPMQQLQIPGDGMDAHLQAPILPQPQPSMEEEQPRQPTGPGQCAEAGQLNAWHRPAACLVRQQVQPQGPPQHPQVPPVHRQAQAGSPQAPLLPPHLPPVQQQGPHAQQQVPLAQQRAPQQPASNPVQQPQVPPVQPRGQGGHPLAQPEQLQAPPPGQQQTVAGTTFAEGGQAANTTTALPPVGRGGAVEAESQVRPEQQLGSAGPTAAEADGIGAAQGGQRVGREGQEYEQIGVTALEQQEQEQGGEGRAPSGQQLARSAVQHAALDPPAGLAQLPLAPAHQGPPARPVQQQAPAVQPQEPPVLPQAQGEQRLADQGQQGAPAQPPPAQGLPASRLSPATLCGYVASEEQLPPVREGDGELRRCGLTFHPDLALGVRAAMDAWQEGLGPGGLAETDPSTQQLYVGELGEDVLEVHRTWAQQHPHVEAALQEGQAVLQEQNLDPEQVADGVASLLGWSAKWDQEWPQGRVEMEGVEPFGGAAGERRGLRATAHIARSSVIGVASGYVMPADVSRTFVSRGFQFCSAEVRAELDRRAGRDVTPAWRVLAWSYMTGYSGGHKLCMLGYGNLAALVNDPRVNPLGGDGVGGGQQHHQHNPAAVHQGANCAVVPVVARGLVLPVLVAVRDIQPGEELLRDYGAEWWREKGFVRAWRYLTGSRRFDDRTMEGLLGAGADAAAGH